MSSTVSGINSTWQGESHSIYSFSGGPLEKPDTPFGLTIYSEDIGVFGEMSLQPVRVQYYKSEKMCAEHMY